MCLFVRVRWCDLVSLANVSMHVILSVAMVADDAHRGCDEAGESVPPEVEHDSQLAEGGGHVSTAAFRGDLCLCVPGTSYRNSVRNVWSVPGDSQQFFFFFMVDRVLSTGMSIGVKSGGDHHRQHEECTFGRDGFETPLKSQPH